MTREEVVADINARIRSGRVPFKTPERWKSENLELILRLSWYRMGDAVRSGPHTNEAIINSKHEIDILANALAGIDL